MPKVSDEMNKMEEIVGIFVESLKDFIAQKNQDFKTFLKENVENVTDENLKQLMYGFLICEMLEKTEDKGQLSDYLKILHNRLGEDKYYQYVTMSIEFSHRLLGLKGLNTIFEENETLLDEIESFGLEKDNENYKASLMIKALEQAGAKRFKDIPEEERVYFKVHFGYDTDDEESENSKSNSSSSDRNSIDEDEFEFRNSNKENTPTSASPNGNPQTFSSEYRNKQQQEAEGEQTSEGLVQRTKNLPKENGSFSHKEVVPKTSPRTKILRTLFIFSLVMTLVGGGLFFAPVPIAAAITVLALGVVTTVFFGVAATKSSDTDKYVGVNWLVQPVSEQQPSSERQTERAKDKTEVVYSLPDNKTIEVSIKIPKENYEIFARNFGNFANEAEKLLNEVIVVSIKKEGNVEWRSVKFSSEGLYQQLSNNFRNLVNEKFPDADIYQKNTKGELMQIDNLGNPLSKGMNHNSRQK